MNQDSLLAMSLEIFRIAPAVCGLIIGLRFLSYNPEEWNLDRLYRRLRYGRRWRMRLSQGDLLPVSPLFTRLGGLVLLAGVGIYLFFAYEPAREAVQKALP